MLGYNSREILEIDVAVGEWLAHNTPADALIAVDDIGAIGYLSERKLFDLNGLISPEMWPIMKGGEVGLPRDAATARLLSQIQPDYLVIFPEWHWNLAINPQLVREVTQFTTDTRTIIGEQRVVVYEIVDWPFVAEPEPEVETAVSFGDQINLLGYDAQLTDVLNLTLFWEARATMAESYEVFVHFYNEEGQIVAQSDGIPANLLLPTTTWQSGDNIRDQHIIPLPADLPSGSYRIAVGFFFRPTGARLPASGDAHIEADAVFLTDILYESE
jgi:hypothetical protein